MINWPNPDPCASPLQTPERSLIIVGLPASGKTSHARSLLAGRPHYEDIHHWIYYREQHIRVGDDRFGRFLRDLHAGKPWVIDSVEMCERTVRESFVREYLAGLREVVDWLFFENDPEQCKVNAQVLEHRGEGHREHRLREIDRVTAVYDIPREAERRQVFRPATSDPMSVTGGCSDFQKLLSAGQPTESGGFAAMGPMAPGGRHPPPRGDVQSSTASAE